MMMTMTTHDNSDQWQHQPWLWNQGAATIKGWNDGQGGNNNYQRAQGSGIVSQGLCMFFSCLFHTFLLIYLVSFYWTTNNNKPNDNHWLTHTCHTTTHTTASPQLQCEWWGVNNLRNGVCNMATTTTCDDGIGLTMNEDGNGNRQDGQGGIEDHTMIMEATRRTTSDDSWRMMVMREGGWTMGTGMGMKGRALWMTCSSLGGIFFSLKDSYISHSRSFVVIFVSSTKEIIYMVFFHLNDSKTCQQLGWLWCDRGLETILHKSFEVEFESAECCHSAEDHVKCILSSFFLNSCSRGFTVAIFQPIFHPLFTHFLLILLPNWWKGAKK